MSRALFAIQVLLVVICLVMCGVALDQKVKAIIEVLQ